MRLVSTDGNKLECIIADVASLINKIVFLRFTRLIMIIRNIFLLYFLLKRRDMIDY